MVGPSSISYGAPTEKTKLLDPGATFTPALTAVIGGQTAPASGVTFVSRATTVATVELNPQFAKAKDIVQGHRNVLAL